MADLKQMTAPYPHLRRLCLLLAFAFLCMACSAFPGVSFGNGVRSKSAFEGSGSTGSAASETCTSNSTHIGWPVPQKDQTIGNEVEGCIYQTWPDAVRDCVTYLRNNLMPFDVPNAGTLGFPTASTPGVVKDDEYDLEAERKLLPEDESNVALDELPDCLDDGIINRTIHLALSTKIQHPWTARIPRDIFYDNVLSFCATNEARTNWRRLLTEAIAPILEKLKRENNNNATIEMVVETINRHLWTVLAKDASKPIYFKAGQTPLIFDPMSVVAFGYGSCTGLSILLVFALRSAGVPARLVGTPAWWGEPSNGNHNWVEVWTPCHDSSKGRWRFLEPAMGDYGGDVDNLDRDPCKRWFCTKDRFNGKTRVYAARYDRGDNTVYPLAWDLENKDVPGLDRTSYYEEICAKCP